MHETATLALALAALALPSPGGAQVYLGAGVGYARPTGDAYQNLALGDQVGGQIPIVLEAGWRFGPSLSVGGWFRLSPGWAGGDLADACVLADASCSASGFAFGASAAWTFLPEAGFRPWAGLSFGWEQLELDLGGGDRMKLRGFEYLGVQVGGDLPLGSFLVGPWLGAGFGRYGEATVEDASGADTQAIEDPATHVWLSIGVRGRFGF